MDMEDGKIYTYYKIAVGKRTRTKAQRRQKHLKRMY
jgi:hypothetical protein